MASVVVHPAACVRGRVSVPGDKSISHRYALLAALADGRSTIAGYAPGADCASTLACLRALGVRVERSRGGGRETDRRIVAIEGRGVRGLAPAAAPLDAGNSGTTLRLLAGALAGHPFTSVVTGDGSLRRRPMRRIIDPLSRMGARVTGEQDRPPLVIGGSSLAGIDFTPPVPSAQVKSAVLLAGLHASGDTTVREAVPTRDHTERALSRFGVELRRGGGGVALGGGQRLRPADLDVPGDLSSAAFWATAAAALPGSDVTLEDVGLNPSRTEILTWLARAGARIDLLQVRDHAGERRGSIRVRPGAAAGLAVGPADVPGLIDELPVLAALATHGGELEVTGAGELRHKESDRITALADGLRALGGHVEEMDDGFHVAGRRRLAGGEADAAGDHRLAMAFAVAALGGRQPSRIRNAEAVDVSYPGFFDVLASICVRV